VVRARPRVRWIETQLLTLPALLLVVGFLSVNLADRRSFDSATVTEIRPAVMVAGLLVLISLVLGFLGFRGDQVLLPVTATLAALGLIMVERIQSALGPNSTFYAGIGARHLIYLAAGFAILLAAVVTPHSLELFQRYKYTALLASLALLVVTFIFGTEVGGARLWIAVGPVQIQPSEIVKVTLVIFLAAYLAEKRDLIGSSWRVGFLRLPPIPYLAPMVVMWAASLMVLVVLNDLGSALLFFGIFLVMLYAASGRPIYVLTGLLTFAVACWLAYILFDRIGIRVQNWLDPWRDPLDTGYQQVQSDYALASGGILGTGIGQGQPWRIPAVHTDYVFSAIGEELGLLGTAAVLILYLVLVMRGFAVAIRSSNAFNRLLATGLAATIGLQALIIVGGVVRLIPLTGITLPFVSYGGSSLLTNCLIVGLLLRISGLRRSR
jgi:cell division protein FtsW (lipid II flippase)